MYLIEKVVDEIWKSLEEKIEAFYLAGSRAVGAEEEDPDYDFFGFVNEEYDVEDEKRLNKKLNKKYREEIKFRALSLEELNGEGQKGLITQFIPVSIVIKSFPFWKHLRGKEYSLNDFRINPASAREEAEFYIEFLSDEMKKAKHQDLPIPFEDYVKNVIRLIGAEEQMRGKDSTLDFEKIVNRAPEHAEELADICLKFRKEGKINRDRFFKKLDDYLRFLKRNRGL